MDPTNAGLDHAGAISLRALQSSDSNAVRELLSALDDRDSYLRFCGPRPHDLDPVAAAISNVDSRHNSIGAFIGERLVGVANYVRTDEACAAEVALVVAHDVQLHGIGTLLLDRLRERALAEGVTRFDACVLAENRRMLRVLREAHRPMSLCRDHETIKVHVDLIAQ